MSGKWLIVLVLVAAPISYASAQEPDPADLAASQFWMGPCVGTFVSEDGLALVPSTCLADELDAGSVVEAALNGRSLPEEGVSIEVVYRPSAALSAFGQAGAYPSHRLDLAVVRVADADGAVRTERFLPLAASGLLAGPSFFLSLSDSLEARQTGAWLSGFPLNGSVAAPVTTFYSLFDLTTAHRGEGRFRVPPELVGSTLDLGARINLAVESSVTVPPGTPMITEHFEVLGLAIQTTGKPLPQRTIVASVDALFEVLSSDPAAAGLLMELWQGTRTTKTSNE